MYDFSQHLFLVKLERINEDMTDSPNAQPPSTQCYFREQALTLTAGL